jgi:hypothetical protein
MILEDRHSAMGCFQYIEIRGISDNLNSAFRDGNCFKPVKVAPSLIPSEVSICHLKGYTTLIESILKSQDNEWLYLSGDEFDITEVLTNTTTTNLRKIIGDKKSYSFCSGQVTID